MISLLWYNATIDSMSFLITPMVSVPPPSLPSYPYTFPLDSFQQHAICAIAKDENVLVCAKTGSGKTLIGEYQIYHSLAKGKRVFYTTPIKSLSNQKFYDLKHQFKDATVGIYTGDLKFCPDAQIVIMTTEILRNLLYKKGSTTEHLGLTAAISLDNVDAIIFDECHYINDRDRGKVWEETMILLPSSIAMVMLSATLDHPEYLAQWLGDLKQKPIHLIETQYRIVPLTHYVLTEDYQMVTLMDAKETYHEKTYLEWLQRRQTVAKEKMAYDRKVSDSKRVNGEFVKGAVQGKVHTSHFIHQMNETVGMLEKKELLPALFFVLSRKQCESYADKVETTLLTSSETASVKHIIAFHLHRHMDTLEKVPQYHQIHHLLVRGLAFHHSGLLPVLKEIVEILFSKGFVKLLFCTETFAVGLNMPTKTVLFAGFKKYDDQTDSMRMLRNDEYIQMAGRAGRRGKDDKGVVMYLPDREPITPTEMHQMIKGHRPPITSRMEFNHEFILKTIQASEPNQPLKWLQLMEQSYWFQQRQTELRRYQKERDQVIIKMNEIAVTEPYYSECKKRNEIERQMKLTANAARKDLQRQLDTVKNKQLGPKWNKAWADYHLYKTLEKQLEEWNNDIAELENHKDSIQPVMTFLHQMGYLTHDQAQTITVADLTLKGILATEVNEGHPILMTELYIQGVLHSLSSHELVSTLSCFLGDSRNNDSSPHGLPLLTQIEAMAASYEALEASLGVPLSVKDNWAISTDMVEPMRRWMQGEHASIICAEYELFEGNFIRAVMKLANILDEWLAMATYCQHVEQVNKITEVRQYLVRDLVMSDSLYLRL